LRLSRLAALQFAVVPGLLLGMSHLALAGSIVTSKHNLSAYGTGNIKAVTETEICIFCHTLHHLQQFLVEGGGRAAQWFLAALPELS